MSNNWLASSIYIKYSTVIVLYLIYILKAVLPPALIMGGNYSPYSVVYNKLPSIITKIFNQ